jgi:hypothetical protein
MEACLEIADAIHNLAAVVLLAVIVWVIFK